LACDTHISNLTALSLADHPASLALSRLVWSAFECSNELFPPRDLPLSDDHPVWEMKGPTFLRWLWHGAQMIAVRDPRNPLFDAKHLLTGTSWTEPPKTLRLGSVATVHGALCAMWRFLQYWPETWETTLDRIVTLEDNLTIGKTRFPAIIAQDFQGSEWSWLHQGWMAFMRARMYSTARVYPWLRYYRAIQQDTLPLSPPALSQREAAQQLGIGEETLKRLIDTDKLKTTMLREGNGQRQWQLIEAESLRQLQLVREQHLTLAQAAAYLGVSEEQVVALVAAGMLAAESGPLIDSTTIWRFIPELLQEILTSWVGHLPAQVCPIDEPTMYIDRVQRILSGARVRLPKLLLAMQQGDLPAFRSLSVVSLATVWYRQVDVLAYLAQQRRSSGKDLLSVNEVCQRLHCKPVTLRYLYAAGLLIPFTDDTDLKDVRHQYAEEDVATFLERYITSAQAAIVLGVTRLTVQNWVRSGRLKARTGPDIAYRFDKTELLRWRYERMTFGEAMQLLGVSKSTLHRWVVRGELIPLEDMGGKQRWFRRTDVEQMVKPYVSP
jgi:excisionase family DNA binding protein